MAVEQDHRALAAAAPVAADLGGQLVDQILLAAVLWGERRAGAGGEAWYWAAIVIVRTAATNLADLTTHDMHLAAPLVIAALALLLAAVVRGRREAAAGPDAMPVTDGWYWAGMLIAGTLGTALGDYAADATGLGVGWSATVFAVLVIALLGFGGRVGVTGKPLYWAAIVLIRTAGTNLGDYLVDDAGLGLIQSTAATGLLLIVTMLAWQPRGAQPATAPVKR